MITLNVTHDRRDLRYQICEHRTVLTAATRGEAWGANPDRYTGAFILFSLSSLESLQMGSVGMIDTVLSRWWGWRLHSFFSD